MSNGVPVTITDLVQGNILYEESDVRSGNQVQFITTKAFNLSSVANPALSFFHLYNQNQDNIGAVEYSVDGGTNWLPVVYYLDQTDRGGDIVLMPEGYHPNVAAPGVSINFIWMMAANREDEDRQYGVVNVQPEFAAMGSGLDKGRSERK